MVIGKIGLVDGVFYVKRSQHSDIIKLTKDDDIYKNDKIFGCVSNRKTNCVFINFNTGGEVVFFGCEEYNIDECLYV